MKLDVYKRQGLVRPNEGDAAANVASQVSGVRQVVTLFEFIN